MEDWKKIEERAKEIILEQKRLYGSSIVILTHHYQRPEIVEVGDFRGDSYGLSKWAANQTQAKRIVFCGVHFMAESAAILARPDQEVYHPDTRAGCPMADMAQVADVARALHIIHTITQKEPVLVAYMNTSADVKALCGKTGGSICTSSNAKKVLGWALGLDRPVLFVPDEFLGRNTLMDMDKDPPIFDPIEPDGGLDPERIKKAKVILWKGYCHVHTHFSPDMIEKARALYPECKIVVHPECRPEVVAGADAVGSTEFIVRFVRDAGQNSVVVVGTEVNLVTRLAKEYQDRKIIPLTKSLCPNMYRITLSKLSEVLTSWPPDRKVDVSEDIKRYARISLQNMLSLGG